MRGFLMIWIGIFCLHFTATAQDLSYDDNGVAAVKPHIIAGKKYTAIGLKSGYFFIKTASGKIVFETQFDPWVREIDFKDFNNDGIIDIIVKLSVADSDDWELIMYDPSAKKFWLAGDCTNAVKVTGSKYFCTYADCCMGKDFTSKLCYIRNYHVVTLASFHYSAGEGIYYYKFSGTGKKLIRKVTMHAPLDVGPQDEFAANYWAKNWRKYQNSSIE